MKFSIKNVFLLTILSAVIINILVFSYINQKFVCDKSKNICYTTISGVKVSPDIQINSLALADVKKNAYKTMRGKHDNGADSAGLVTTNYHFDPYVKTKDGQEYNFYKMPNVKEAKAREDVQALFDFMNSDRTSLELKSEPSNFKGLLFVLDIFVIVLLIRFLQDRRG